MKFLNERKFKLHTDTLLHLRNYNKLQYDFLQQTAIRFIVSLNMSQQKELSENIPSKFAA